MPEDDVFISYAHEDRLAVAALAEGLNAVGVTTWLDRDLAPGKPWSTEIEDQLKAAFVVVVVLTPESSKSDFVRKELSFALNSRRPIIPVMLSEVELPFLIVDLHYIDARNGRNPIPSLVDAINRLRSTTSQDQPPLLAIGQKSAVLPKEKSQLQQRAAIFVACAAVAVVCIAFAVQTLPRFFANATDPAANAVSPPDPPTKSRPTEDSKPVSPLVATGAADDITRLRGATIKSIVRIAAGCEDETIRELSTKYENEPAELLRIIKQDYLK